MVPVEVLWDGDGVPPPPRVWTDTPVKTLPFYPSDAGGKKLCPGNLFVLPNLLRTRIVAVELVQNVSGKKLDFLALCGLVVGILCIGYMDKLFWIQKGYFAFQIMVVRTHA